MSALASIVFAGSSGMRVSAISAEITPTAPTPAPVRKSGTAQKPEGRIVDLKGDVGYQITRNDEKYYVVVGNTAAHHNGAVITCDSAVRYSESKLECFGNVLINKGTTYIYGERALYDEENDEASVFSQIVKVVDGDATLYTYNFRFNTRTNIGIYYGGGVVTNKENLLESDKGYYYADLKDIICVSDVQMRNDTYQMTGDSVIYNFDTNRARFYTNTNIWNVPEEEYLFADEGSFDRDSQRYTLTRNGYILTREQEIWSDSLDYWRDSGYALLRRDVQMDDSKQKMIALGDWGEYWKEPGDVFLTRNPVIISYDQTQGDTIFIRSDSIFIYTKDPVREREQKALAEAEAKAKDSVNVEAKPEEKGAVEESEAVGESEAEADKKPATKQTKRNMQEELKRRTERASESARKGMEARRGEKPAESKTSEPAEVAESGEPATPAQTSAPVAEEQDSPAEQSAEQPAAETLKEEEPKIDSLKPAADSLATDSLAVDSTKLDTLTKAEKRAALKAQKKHVRDSIKRIKADSLRKKLDEIADRRQAKRTALYRKWEAIDSMHRAKAKLRADERLRRSLARMARKGIRLQPVDSTVFIAIDSMLRAEFDPRDSMVVRKLDSLIAIYFPEVEKKDSVATDTKDTVAVDSTYRLVLGYRNVRIFRNDFQGVCDSLSTSSADSVIHMYISPVLWNEANQITSEKMHIITENQQIVRADFEGKPLTVSEIDTVHYNQVAGKEMSSHFRNNAVYRNDVNGNVQTIYYMQEEGSPEITMMAYIESGDMTSFIEGQQISSIIYRGNPTYTFYPMDKIPADRSLKLEGFKWEKDRRPTRDSVLMRNLRSSIRAEKEALSRPDFPIERAIRNHRERLVGRKEWVDRTDTLTVETIEWLETLSDVE